MSCTSDPPSCSLRELGPRGAQQHARGPAGLVFVALFGAACSGSIGPRGLGATPTPNPVGGGGMSIRNRIASFFGDPPRGWGSGRRSDRAPAAGG